MSKHDFRPIVTETVFEQMVDRTVMRRLYQDLRYRNAENAEEQSEAEAKIEHEVLCEYSTKYRVA
jgi:hypothetical protein